jgi:hypothetical protein
MIVLRNFIAGLQRLMIIAKKAKQLFMLPHVSLYTNHNKETWNKKLGIYPLNY